MKVLFLPLLKLSAASQAIVVGLETWNLKLLLAYPKQSASRGGLDYNTRLTIEIRHMVLSKPSCERDSNEASRFIFDELVRADMKVTLNSPFYNGSSSTSGNEDVACSMKPVSSFN